MGIVKGRKRLLLHLHYEGLRPVGIARQRRPEKSFPLNVCFNILRYKEYLHKTDRGGIPCP